MIFDRPLTPKETTYISICLAVLSCLILGGFYARAGDISPVLVCQLRVPKSASLNPKTTRINLFTSSGAGAHFLWGYGQKVQKEDGQFPIFDPDDFMLDSDSRRAVDIDDFATPEQVFLLHLRRKPKKQDWSPWRRPDFLVAQHRGDFGWAFMYNLKFPGVIITNIPKDSFELRYRVEMQNLDP